MNWAYILSFLSARGGILKLSCGHVAHGVGSPALPAADRNGGFGLGQNLGPCRWKSMITSEEWRLHRNVSVPRSAVAGVPSRMEFLSQLGLIASTPGRFRFGCSIPWGKYPLLGVFCTQVTIAYQCQGWSLHWGDGHITHWDCLGFIETLKSDPRVNVDITMENHHVSWVNSLIISMAIFNSSARWGITIKLLYTYDWYPIVSYGHTLW